MPSTTSSSKASRGPTTGPATRTGGAWYRSSPPAAPAMTPSDRSPSTTSIASDSPHYLQAYDPSRPVGLGPSSSSDGLAFSANPGLPPGLLGDAFIARYNSSVISDDGTTYTYGDVVAVDPITGATTRVAYGFANPLAVFADLNGNLLVSDYGTGDIYFLQAEAAIPESPSFVLLSVGLVTAVGLAWRRASSRDRPADVAT